MSEEIKENKENSEVVIKITDLVKEYKMFSRKKDRLLEAIVPKYERHSTFKAIDNLNLEIRRGEVLGILGKNGAGKSTLLKMITGVVFPTSGEIKINGKISSLLELGTAFNPELTGVENIYQHGEVMGLTKEQIKEKEQEIIEFADIGDHLMQPVKTYSSGMFARLAFACAINVDPDILIVDEVLSVGDMAFQLKCFKKFEQFKKSGKTILFVTHSITDVIRNCTRSIIIDGGKKIFEGSVKEGAEKYKKLIVGLDINEESQTEDNEENTQEISENNEIKNKDENEIENIEENEQKNPNVEKVNLKQNIEEFSKDNVKEISAESDQNEINQNWKASLIENDKVIDYGNMKAEVIDYGIFDTKNRLITMIQNDEEVILKSKVKFNDTVINPIFTMTLKDFNGLDICGTNTYYEKIYTGEFKKGDIAIVEFKQKFPVAPNKYTLSFSCTNYTEKGELEILNRKYDALLVEIGATKENVGLLAPNSKIKVKKIKTKKNI